MASMLRFSDLAPSLTPPPSDRGECEETTMLNSDTYLPEVFYPSPAPSFSQHRPAFAPQSPDMGHSDTTYDTEEDSQHVFFSNASETQPYTSTTSLSNASLYQPVMPYPSYESGSWLPYAAYPSAVQMFPYSTEDQTGVYPSSFLPQAPSSVVHPPVPQGITGGSFNFAEPISKADPMGFAGIFSAASPRHTSPAHPSTTSLSEVSSRSPSPGLPHQQNSGNNSRRASLLSQRSSSSSLHAYGIPIRSPDSTTVPAWRCAYPNCTSRAVFTRGCDLRKHYNRHSKHLFCRVDGCPQSEAACIAMAQQQTIQAGGEPSDLSNLAVSGGFSSKKDRARHEAKHNPGIKCEWQGASGEECGRLFSRMDNMKDHVRRIHNKGQAQPLAQHSKRKAAQ